jgi:nucleoside-diphosphate-sugar epimerase
MIYIIGKRSNLSEALKNRLQSAILVSTAELLKDGFEFEPKEENTIIFNNFQKATHLNDISSPYGYISNAILSTAAALEKIKNAKISKIIYSSSASVYGSNIYCNEQDALQPLNLHSSLKLANEKLIEKFCVESGIDFTITRVFNMYGGNDHFSVISKLLNCVKTGDEFTLVNNGNAIRDFIHIDDVVDVYEKLLRHTNIKYLNVASGKGVSIGQMIDFLRMDGVDIKTKVIYKDELKVSTASTELLSSIADVESFKSVYEFMKEVFADGVK